MSLISKIVSGGQTGVDRGALEAALDLGFPYGGYVPKGRRSEDGIVPLEFATMTEDTRKDYLHRTELNVVNSDATLILTLNVEGAVTGGTKKTAEFARMHGRPCVFVVVSPEVVNPAHLDMALRFLVENQVRVLNVAGPRESKQPGVQEAARKFMEAVIDAARSK